MLLMLHMLHMMHKLHMLQRLMLLLGQTLRLLMTATCPLPTPRLTATYPLPTPRLTATCPSDDFEASCGFKASGGFEASGWLHGLGPHGGNTGPMGPREAPASQGRRFWGPGPPGT